MNRRDDYFKLISKRGSAYGEQGGLLDLLIWCRKIGLKDVTIDEARAFYENPAAPYPARKVTET